MIEPGEDPLKAAKGEVREKFQSKPSDWVALGSYRGCCKVRRGRVIGDHTARKLGRNQMGGHGIIFVPEAVCDGEFGRCFLFGIL